MESAVWEWLAWIGLMIGIAGLAWLSIRLIKKSQSRDRRYGNPDHWDPAGNHG
jgi:hypothetical protein